MERKRWWWFRNYFSACHVVWCCTLSRWSAVISTSQWGTQALIPLHFLCFSHPLTPLYSTKPSLAMLWTFSLQHHSMSQLAWPSYAYWAQREEVSLVPAGDRHLRSFLDVLLYIPSYVYQVLMRGAEVLSIGICSAALLLESLLHDSLPSSPLASLFSVICNYVFFLSYFICFICLFPVPYISWR